MNSFRKQCLVTHRNLGSIHRDIDCFIEECKTSVINLSDIAHVRDKIEKLSQNYNTAAQTYEQFLKGHRTEKSVSEEVTFRFLLEAANTSVRNFKDYLQTLQPSVNSGTLPKRTSRKSKSHKTLRSRISNDSSKLTAALLEHTVKVEQARTRLKYAEEEAELLQQEAALKSRRDILTVKKELESAENGLGAVKMVLDFDDSCENSESESESRNREETDQFLTNRYVAENVYVKKPPPDPNIDSHTFTLPVDDNQYCCTCTQFSCYWFESSVSIISTAYETE
ncbi:hypothetical protein FSP39_000724 [Pinctada imbricata]|uniref:Uncharacterized protein n=1 Tax=Pinctada imbricata TaxID=66713 RepID=A0AA88YGF9_PINIB|nr:hypothetical protein FSP39_000724 [Pinctada imbricata]